MISALTVAAIRRVSVLMVGASARKQIRQLACVLYIPFISAVSQLRACV